MGGQATISSCITCRLALAPWVSAAPFVQAGEAGAVAAAAAAAAGEPLPQRLAALLGGLLPGTWAAWLRGEQVRLNILPLPVPDC